MSISGRFESSAPISKIGGYMKLKPEVRESCERCVKILESFLQDSENMTEEEFLNVVKHAFFENNEVKSFLDSEQTPTLEFPENIQELIKAGTSEEGREKTPEIKPNDFGW